MKLNRKFSLLIIIALSCCNVSSSNNEFVLLKTGIVFSEFGELKKDHNDDFRIVQTYLIEDTSRFLISVQNFECPCRLVYRLSPDPTIMGDICYVDTITYDWWGRFNSKTNMFNIQVYHKDFSGD